MISEKKLDYTAGCVNFRDVGEFVNLLADKKIIYENKIFRGGSIDFVNSLEEINLPKSIVNLRSGKDKNTFGVNHYHFPVSNDFDKYYTHHKDIRNWLNEVLNVFEDDSLEYPVLIHCFSGKDRTGVVIAALLMVLNIDLNIIIEEYLLSDGNVSRDMIKIAIDGMKNVETYFNRLNLQKIRNSLIF